MVYEKKDLVLRDFIVMEKKVKIVYESGNEKIIIENDIPVHDDMIIALNKFIPRLADMLYIPKPRYNKVKVHGISFIKDHYVLKGTVKVISMNKVPVVSDKITDEIASGIYQWKDIDKDVENLQDEVYLYYTEEKIGKEQNLFKDE